jgi:hypothetical protein
MRTLAPILALALAACSSYSPSVTEAPAGKIVVYKLPIEQAKTLVATTMSSHFAGRDVTPLTPPAIGYSTYTRMMLDTWSTTVTILPVHAMVAGQEVDALRIDVQGSGSSVLTGRVIFEGFKDRLAAELAPSAVIADSYTPAVASPVSSPILPQGQKQNGA